MVEERTPAAAVGTVRVLIVDDQQPFRAAARSVIDRLGGFGVVAECESGEAALEWCAAHDADLVLMDIHMGELDGIETTRRLLHTHPELRVVLLSSYELQDLPAGARRSGAMAYVNKDELSGRVLRRLWEQRGQGGFST